MSSSFSLKDTGRKGVKPLQPWTCHARQAGMVGKHPVNWEYLKAEWYPQRPHVLPCTTLHVKGHLSPASVQVAKNMKTLMQILIFMI